MAAERTIFVVDDDASIRDALALLLALHGYSVRSFASAASFLGVTDGDARGIVILDLKLADGDGLSVLRELRTRAPQLPVIMLTAYGDVATARNALRGGAADFLEKPVDEELLLASLAEQAEKSRQVSQAQARVQPVIERLTGREQEILNHLIQGETTREIGVKLGISPRTVETHRANIMEKFGVSRMPELLRLLYQSGVER